MAIVVAPAGSVQVWERPVLGTDELLLSGQLQDDGGGGQPRHCSHHPQGDVVEHGLDRGDIEGLAHSQAQQHGNNTQHLQWTLRALREN